jgi:hypothetical protein
MKFKVNYATPSNEGLYETEHSGGVTYFKRQTHIIIDHHQLPKATTTWMLQN